MRNFFCTARLINCGLFFLLFPLPVPAATTTVLMGNYFFNPTNSNISTGDTVLWTNTSATFHDSRSTNSVWASPQLPANGTYAFTFTNAGYYPYFCFSHRVQNPHTGTVSVVTTPTNPPAAVTILNPTLISGAFKFSFATQVGYNYSGQFTPALNPVSWFTFTNIAGNGSVVQFTDSSLTNSARYYRVLAQ